MRDPTINLDCDLASFDGFIAAMARRVSRLNGGGYNDFEDYMQIGRIAAWQASLKWPGRGSFPCYARMTIRHEIISAAIESRFVVSAPRNIKRLANWMIGLRAEGRTEADIDRFFACETEELPYIRQMVAPVCRGEIR